MTEQTFILGKDAALEDSISKFQQKLTALGFNIEEASWLNPVPNVWSVHIRDKDCPQCFSNGKGASKKAALKYYISYMIQSLQVSDMHTSPFASASTCRSLASFQYLVPSGFFF